MSTTPVIGKPKKINGIAGQYQYNVTATYPGEDPVVYGFVGSVYGGRVIAISPSGIQTFVHPGVMDRCGATLNPEWIRRFFA